MWWIGNILIYLVVVLLLMGRFQLHPVMALLAAAGILYVIPVLGAVVIAAVIH